MKFIFFIGSILCLTFLTSCEQKPNISACDCLKNHDAGNYDDLNPNDLKIRKYCNEKYAGWATMLKECNEERGVKW